MPNHITQFSQNLPQLLCYYTLPNMSFVFYTKTTTRVVKAVIVTMTITTTEVITVTPNETALNFTPDETALNPNNRPDSFSPHSKSNCTLNTSDRRSRRVFKLPESESVSKPGSEEEHSRKRKRELENEPFIVKTGLPGRPKKLPSGTTEWVKLSQDKNVFCHPTEPNRDQVRFEDALPPLYFRMETKNPKIKCKFQIYFFALARCC